MKPTDFSSKVTSHVLNENMFKRFGKRLDLKKYTREQLEDTRNKLRTRLATTEQDAQFNELLSNESYQRDKMIMAILNERIKEMLSESKKTAAKEEPKKSGAKKPLGDQIKDAQDNFKKNLKTGNGFKFEEKPAAKAKPKKSGKPDFLDLDKDGNKTEPMKNAAKKKSKKSVSESHVASYKMIIEGLRRAINEDEEGKAKDITAGADMVNDFTSWMQRVGQFQTKSMIELADSIRSNFTQAEAEAFKNAIQPALQSALDALTQSREQITQAVAVLAGEEAVQTPMGSSGGDLASQLPDFDNVPDIDSMNMDSDEDDFAASDAAAGGPETAGRELRENAQIKRRRQINEANRIMRTLAK